MTPKGSWAAEMRAGASRFARSTIRRALPVRVYLAIAAARARLRAKYSVPPAHVRENLRRSFATERSPAEIERVARGYMECRAHRDFQHTALALRGISGFWGCAIAGVEELSKALGLGHGVLLASAHLGHPRLITAILRAHGIVAWRVTADPTLVGDIPAGLDVRPILDALARNESVLVLGDGMHSVQFETATLLGRDYPFPTGLMRIAMATGAPVLPVWGLPEDDRARVRVEIHPPLAIDPGRSLGRNLEAFVRLLEEQIRRTPHLWWRWGVPDLFETAALWAKSDLRERESSNWKWRRYSSAPVSVRHARQQ